MLRVYGLGFRVERGCWTIGFRIKGSRPFMCGAYLGLGVSLSSWGLRASALN